MKYDVRVEFKLGENVYYTVKLIGLNYYNAEGTNEKEVLEQAMEIAYKNGQDVSGNVYDNEYEIHYSNLY